MSINVKIHPHARARLAERGAAENEVIETVRAGESYPARFGRSGFRRNFVYESEWSSHYYATKQVEVIAVPEDEGWLVITVIVKFF